MKRLLSIGAAALLLISLCLPAYAADTQPLTSAPSASEIQIWTAEDMLKIADKPDATYRLMRDIDMSGVDWDSPSFSGVFHGNNHALLNLKISKPCAERFTAVDVNEKQIEFQAAGLFGVMHEARVDYLTLIGVSADMDAESPIFMGAVAGAAYESIFENCVVSGTMELRSASEAYGLGGIVGYGSTSFTNCTVVATLICSDANLESKDDAYLGGLLAFGFTSCHNCNVDMDGYLGVAGHTYSGGAMGLMMQYGLIREGKAEVSGCSLNGQLYVREFGRVAVVDCEKTVGEVIKTWNYSIDSNSGNLETHVIREDDSIPHPEKCAEPKLVEELVDPDCDNFGYSLFTCAGCGYRVRRDYTLKDHRVSDWKEFPQIPDMMTGVCGICQTEVYEFRSLIPELQVEEIPEVPTTLPDVELQDQTAVTEQTDHDFTYILAWFFLLTALGSGAGLVVYLLGGFRKK